MHPVEALLVPLGKLFRNRHADASASVACRPELATPHRLEITSPRFADGEEIPSQFCGRFIGSNVSPALAWGALPPTTAEMLLVMEDLDSPGTAPRLHAVATFDPTPNRLDDGALGAGSTRARFLTVGRKQLTYEGPRPLPGHGPHHYRIHLYALDQRLDLEQLAGVEPLLDAAHGHVLAAATLTGTRTS